MFVFSPLSTFLIDKLINQPKFLNQLFPLLPQDEENFIVFEFRFVRFEILATGWSRFIPFPRQRVGICLIITTIRVFVMISSRRSGRRAPLFVEFGNRFAFILLDSVVVGRADPRDEHLGLIIVLFIGLPVNGDNRTDVFSGGRRR